MKVLNLKAQGLSEDAFIFLEENKTACLWKNEKKYVYFGIKSLSIENLSLRVTGFPQRQIKLYQVKGIEAHLGRGMVWGEIPAFPTAFFNDRLQPYTIGEEISSKLFCFEYIGEEVGEFQGSIDLLQEGALVTQLPVFFKVLPIALERKERSYGLELWQYPFCLARYYGIQPKDYFKETHRQYLTEDLKLYKEAGGDTIVTTIVHDPWNHQTYDAYPSLVHWRKVGGTFTFDFTWFDEYVEINHSLGIHQKIKCFSLLPWEDKIYYYDEHEELQQKIYPVGSAEWQEVWGQFLRSFVKHLEKKGWFEKTYIGIDERPAEVLMNVLELLKGYPNSQGEVLKLACAMNYQSFNPELLDQIEDLSISQGHLGEKAAFRAWSEARREKGFFTSIYNCVGDYPGMFLYSHPWENQWVLWNTVAYGGDGFLRWALDAWVEEPLKNGSHWYWESGDPFLIYPQGQLSVRFQQLMEGMNEIQKYFILKVKNPKLVVPLEELLDKMPALEGKPNAYGAQVSGDPENFEKLTTLIQEIKKLLEQATTEYLKEFHS